MGPIPIRVNQTCLLLELSADAIWNFFTDSLAVTAIL